MRRGFTMIELLMVTLIVAVLGTVAVAQFLDFRLEAKRGAAEQAMASVRGHSNAAPANDSPLRQNSE